MRLLWITRDEDGVISFWDAAHPKPVLDKGEWKHNRVEYQSSELVSDSLEFDWDVLGIETLKNLKPGEAVLGYFTVESPEGS